MKQSQVSKRHRPSAWWLDPLPTDPRDPDIVRAKELARRSHAVGRQPGRPSATPAGGPART
jgi:hypothetical protein